jgi:hypothetical protein
MPRQSILPAVPLLNKELKLGTYRLELTRELQAPGIQNTNPIASNPLSVRLIQNE